MIKCRFIALFVFFPVLLFAQGFASFDGQKDYAIISDTILPEGDFTAECFFRICDSLSDKDMTIFSSGGLKSSIQADSNGQTALVFHHGNFLRTVFLPTISQSDWQHLAITYRSIDSNIRVFHNGAFVDTYQRRVAPSGTFQISDTAHPLKGFIDEFRVSATSIYATGFSVAYAELPQTAMTLHLFGFDSLDNGAFLDENTLDTLYPKGNSLWRNSVSMTPVDSICAGTVVRLEAVGANQYSWMSKGGVNVFDLMGDTSNVTGALVFLSAKDTGSVSLYAEDINQCMTSVFQTVNPLPLPVFTLGGDTTFCASDSFAIAIQGYPTYEWSDGDTFSHNFIGQPGWHWLQITDSNGCQFRDSLWANVIPNPEVNLGNDTTLLPGYSMYLNAGPGFASYNWSTAETSQRILVTLSKEYRVTVTDTNGCKGVDDIVVFIDGTSVEEAEDTRRLSIYPNPAGRQFTINGVKAHDLVSIYGLNGELMFQKENEYNGDLTILSDSFKAGLYLVRVQSGSSVAQEILIKSP